MAPGPTIRAFPSAPIPRGSKEAMSNSRWRRQLKRGAPLHETVNAHRFVLAACWRFHDGDGPAAQTKDGAQDRNQDDAAFRGRCRDQVADGRSRALEFPRAGNAFETTTSRCGNLDVRAGTSAADRRDRQSVDAPSAA